MLLCTGNLSCGGFSGKEIRKKAARLGLVKVKVTRMSEADLPALDDANRVLVVPSVDELPRGFFFYEDPRIGYVKLHAVGDYPTRKEPHLVIAAMSWEPVLEKARVSAEQAAGDLAYEAAALGANAVVLRAGSETYAYALRLSAGQPRRAPAHAKLIRRERRKLRGFAPMGRARKSSMADATEVEVKARPGRCYAVVFALDRNAHLSEAALAGIRVDVKTDDPLLQGRSVIAREDIENEEDLRIFAPVMGRYVHLRSFSREIGCAWQRGSISLAVRSLTGETNLGAGDFWTQLLVRRISQDELAEKKAAHDREWEEAGRAAEEMKAAGAE
jgi:hypothetical protein